MPLDSSIALSVRPPETQSPLAVIGGLLQMKEGQARIALQSSQQRAADAQTANVEEQVQQKARENAGYNTIAEISKDPATAAAIGGGDFSSLENRGVDPRILSSYRKNVLELQATKLKNTKEEHELEDANRQKLADAGDGLLSLGDDDKIRSAYPGTRAELIREKLIAPDKLPDQIEGADQLKAWLADNALQAGANRAALARKGTQQKIDSEAAQAASDLANANNKNTMTPIEAAGKKTANDQAAKVLAGTSALGITAEEAAKEAETARHNKNTESTTRAEIALKQKQFDATFGAGLDVNGQPLSPEAMKAAALQDPTALAIAHYQLPGPPVQTRGGAPSPILRKVLAINPSYDGTQFQTRNKVQQDFSAAGASGKAITSADTALAHLDTISKAGAALNNMDLPKLNQLANALGVQAGKDPKVVYDGIVRMVAPELSRAVISAAGGEGERQDMASGFSSNANDKQREGLIAGTATLLAARVKKQAHAYESSMGVPLDIEKRLSPESLAVMKRYGGGGSGGSHAVGDVVSIGGKNVKITAIHGDGTFDGDEVKK